MNKENPLQIATGTYIRDVWFDGNEEIIEVGALCPNDGCGNPVAAIFTRPRIIEKTIQDRGCGIFMRIIRPAFGFEIEGNGVQDEILAQRPAVIQPFHPENTTPSIPLKDY